MEKVRRLCKSGSPRDAARLVLCSRYLRVPASNIPRCCRHANEGMLTLGAGPAQVPKFSLPSPYFTALSKLRFCGAVMGEMGKRGERKMRGRYPVLPPHFQPSSQLSCCHGPSFFCHFYYISSTGHVGNRGFAEWDTIHSSLRATRSCYPAVHG